MDVCVLAAFFGFIAFGERLSWERSERHVATLKQGCHTLQRVDLARPFLVLPANKKSN